MLQPVEDLLLDLVADLPERVQHLLLGYVLRPRIIEDPDKPRAYTREGLGAILLGAGAHDDRVVEAHLPQVGPQALRMLVGDVYADLLHRRYGVGVDLVAGVTPRAVDLELVTCVVPQERLGHLAPRRVLRAQEQHLLRPHRLCLLLSALGDLDQLRCSPSLQLLRELVGQVAVQDALGRPLHVVLHTDELDSSDLLVGIDENVPRVPVSILWLADRAGVHEVDALDHAVPGLVGVTEGDQVPLPGTSGLRHLRAEGVGPVLGTVERVEGRGAVDEGQLRAALVPAAGPEVHPEGQGTEEAFGLEGDMLPGPLVAEVRELLLMRGLRLAAAVLVVGGDRGVVVACDPRYPPLLQKGDYLVGPGRVAAQVAKVVDRIHVPTLV